MRGGYDLHFHVGPEVIPRRCDALRAGEELRRDGMSGAVLKSHYFSTAPFAQMAREQGFDNVYGALVLNHYVGGLNPFALRGSLRMGMLKIVWMPTVHAAAHLAVRKAGGAEYDIPPEWTGGTITGTPVDQVPPISVTDGAVQERLKEILRIIADNGLVLATGHISREEVFHLVPLARSLGVRKIILTHPSYETTRLSLDDLRELTALDGVYEEQSYALMPIDGQTPAQVAGYIREVGAEHTIMTTDLGQRGRQSSGEGMALFRELMEGEGISLAELDVMTIQNPARLLGV